MRRTSRILQGGDIVRCDLYGNVWKITMKVHQKHQRVRKLMRLYGFVQISPNSLKRIIVNFRTSTKVCWPVSVTESYLVLSWWWRIWENIFPLNIAIDQSESHILYVYNTSFVWFYIYSMYFKHFCMCILCCLSIEVPLSLKCGLSKPHKLFRATTLW